MLTELPLVARARLHAHSIAFRTATSEHSYLHLLQRSEEIARALPVALALADATAENLMSSNANSAATSQPLRVEPISPQKSLDSESQATPEAPSSNGLVSDNSDLQEQRVALLIPAGAEYAAAQWGIWRAGGIMLPLCLSATEPEWEYALTDSGASVLLTTVSLAEKLRPLCQRLQVPILVTEDIASANDIGSADSKTSLPAIVPQRRAMILYTSGTTSKPKGVVTTHRQIQAQIESLVAAWEWSETDRIPLFLPLHHIHGIINVMSCALWSGACIEPFARFDAATILNRVRDRAYSLFMAVPTIYVKLIEALQAMPDIERTAVIAGFQQQRLMVSGSAALPASVHATWFELVGQRLLERYGMTEIGMALSNPYHGERRPGSVGIPLPGVSIRLKAEDGSIVSAEDQPGEIQVSGDGVFLEYWNRPDITRDSFDDGWFRTGDMAVIESGYYRIMGRQSVDIIKSGGYKLSALEIEAVLLEHPEITECAVVGIADDTWGEAVAVVAVLTPESTLEIDTLRNWCRERLSVYKIPKRLVVVPELPRNAMGKVTKPAVQQLLTSTAVCH